ncbi:MarR family winged helix-turn-helix transcriptional regulator [Streptomyces sp. NRRL F-5135]|uniref:MarR family winged helix-turn-helix transcriptional regulator n=1 Tax=Streptomyces sp. NRRL F-5135 TaxID=1463858 RepID=UPI0007C5C36C|nr:MarR family transcriptional regulator [Streptomyces sp. NRRL F-5135]
MTSLPPASEPVPESVPEPVPGPVPEREPGPAAGPGPELLGTRLRHLLDRLESDVTAVYGDLGLDGFRPRYTPLVRQLAGAGRPCSIQELARATGVTHSAASQTVARMAKDGLVVLEAGEDARHRMVRLTERAEGLLPALDAEWTATAAATAAFEAELPYSLSRLVAEALAALDRRPMRQRIADQGVAALGGSVVVPGARPVTVAGTSYEGGEPPCLLALVCPACDAVADEPSPTVCVRCGERFPER